MESDEVLGIVFAEAKHIAEIDGLYLSGSHGSGCADEFSDVDYVAVAKPENIQTVVERWEAVCRKHFNVVFFAANRLAGPHWSMRSQILGPVLICMWRTKRRLGNERRLSLSRFSNAFRYLKISTSMNLIWPHRFKNLSTSSMNFCECLALLRLGLGAKNCFCVALDWGICKTFL